MEQKVAYFKGYEMTRKKEITEAILKGLQRENGKIETPSYVKKEGESFSSFVCRTATKIEKNKIIVDENSADYNNLEGFSCSAIENENDLISFLNDIQDDITRCNGDIDELPETLKEFWYSFIFDFEESEIISVSHILYSTMSDKISKDEASLLVSELTKEISALKEIHIDRIGFMFMCSLKKSKEIINILDRELDK